MRLIAMPFLYALLSTSLLAQDTNRTERPAVRATGEAVIQARPDQARIDIGVVSQAATAQAASAQNAKQVEAVLASLRKVVGAKGEIRTISYSVNPDYRHPRDGGRPTITGYTAQNLLRVTINDLDQVGPVIDAAMQAGANTIHRLQFTLRDEQAVRAQALQEASKKARANAEAIASALGVRVVRILSAQADAGASIPRFEMAQAAMMAADARVATPVEPGSIEVRAQVSLALEIAQ
jgi:uncharacterized protein